MSDVPHDPDPWQSKRRAVQAAPSFGEMVEALRELQSLVSSSNPPEASVVATRDRLVELAALLRPSATDEWHSPAGKLRDLPGRGHPMLPPFLIDEEDAEHIVAHVHFDDFYLGGNGAVHGGVLPLLFDEILGRLCNLGGRSIARTAYLHVDYRSITPVGAELRVEARFDSEVGRKRMLSGTLHHGDVLCAEATGLFIALNPGQP